MAFAKSVAALGAALVVLIVGKGAWAQAADTAVPPGWLEVQVNEREQKCDKRGERVDAGVVLLACGAAGAWEVSLTEALDERSPDHLRNRLIAALYAAAQKVLEEQLMGVLSDEASPQEVARAQAELEKAVAEVFAVLRRGLA